MEVGRLSASKLSTYCQCPLKYYAGYILKLKEPPGAAAQFGTTFHKIMEELIKNVKNPAIEKKTPDIAEIIKANKLENPVTSFEELKTLVKNTITNGYLSEIKYNHGVECSFEFALKDNSEITMMGLIDRLDIKPHENTALIIDLKTSKKPFTKKELASNLQAKIYAVATARKYENLDKFDIIFWFVRTQNRQLIQLTRKDIDKIETELVDLKNKIANDNNPQPIKNKYCSYCVYYNDCPLYSTKSTSVIGKDGTITQLKPSIVARTAKPENSRTTLVDQIIDDL